THTQQSSTRARRGVGVSSKFSLEECKQYASHLQSTGQGITNPGGYALTIYRSGEVDDFIEDFLTKQAQTSMSNVVDIGQCPDCRGTGFWYPKGTEMGVAKCKHERLTASSTPDQESSANPRLKPSEIVGYSTMVADLLKSGYTLEQATLQLSASFYPEDWNSILTAASSRQNDSGA
ncbi:MAG: hypothetical protein M3Q76_08075, partial [Acidobacteriota bacterium]|nr:hypothetical protein [Acidobacteriota bacterium]